MECARISKWIGPGLVLAALVTWPSFVRAERITSGGLSIDIDPGGSGVCVVLPAVRYDAENCAGINVAGERKKFATWQGSQPVALMHVSDGDSRHHVLVLHYHDRKPEFDKDSARELARVMRENARTVEWKVAALTPDSQLDPTEARIQGVQITSFEVTPALAADDPRRGWSYTLVFAAATDQGVYAFFFAGAPENAAAVSALASRSLATLRAKPAPPPPQKAPSLAYQLGRAVGVLAVFGLFAFVLVRVLLNKSKAKSHYEPEARP
ncbi:hypothetical protein LZC95_24795 [Pendulispora brunnea]|uniref:Uncharacterized protein n=1 Tax=Pendulispora brunnea TaxID=2905690 RepID=A0ABZ2KMX5_9BACT